MTKKYLRIIVAIIVGPISYPMAACGVSLFGFIPAMGFIVAIQWLFYWLLNNKEGMKDSRDGFIFMTMPIWVPVTFWISFIKGEK